MEDFDFDVNAAFVYDLPEKIENKYICVKNPPASPKRGDEEYYVWRFNNFMERHVDCSHEPPVYYYGPLVNPDTVIKRKTQSNENKGILDKIKDKAVETWNETTLNPKQMWLGLDEEIERRQQNAQQYTKGEKLVIPKLAGSYGYKYCVAFGKLLKPKLSPEGKIWITKALDLLQEYMEAGLVNLDWMAVKNKDFNKRHKLYEDTKRKDFYRNIELNNANFRYFAFATHPDAYLDGGLKMLPYSDLVKIMLSPDLAEWWEGDTWEQAGYVAPDVIKQKTKEGLERIMKALDSINRS